MSVITLSSYDSDNYRKYTKSNFLKKYFINRFQATVTEIVSSLQIQTILDVGCGEGFILHYLRQTLRKPGMDYYGFDRSYEAIVMAQEMNKNTHLLCANAMTSPFREKSFDLIICTETLEHTDQPKLILENLIRLSKKYCLLSAPHEPWFRLGNLLTGKNISRWGNDSDHKQNWTRSEFVNLVASEGEIKRVVSSFPWTIVLLQPNS